MDPGHIKPRGLGEDGVFACVLGKPGDRDQSVEGEVTGPGGTFDGRECFDPAGGRHHDLCGVRSDVEATGHPLDEGSAPVGQWSLAAVDAAQCRHLSGSDACNHRLGVDEEPVDLVGSAGLEIDVFHSRNVSAGCDRKWVETQETKRNLGCSTPCRAPE